jgi:hypothetical protein
MGRSRGRGVMGSSKFLFSFVFCIYIVYIHCMSFEWDPIKSEANLENMESISFARKLFGMESSLLFKVDNLIMPKGVI